MTYNDYIDCSIIAMTAAIFYLLGRIQEREYINKKASGSKEINGD